MSFSGNVVKMQTLMNDYSSTKENRLKDSRKVIFIVIVAVIGIFIWRAMFFIPAPGISDKASEVSSQASDLDPQSKESDPDGKETSDKDSGGKDGAPKGEQTADKDGKGSEQAGESDDDKSEQLEAVNLNNVEMKQIIKTIGDWTSKPVILTDDEIMKKKITIYSANKLERLQALSLIYDALRAKGVIAEITEGKIYLKPIAMAKLGSIPTLGSDEPLARLKDRSQIIEKFFHLKSYRPAQMVEIIVPLIAEYGHVTAIGDTGDIAVIDTVENLMRIEKIIKQLDVPGTERTVEKFFVIENGDPTEIVNVLEMILDVKQSRGRSKGSSRPKTYSKGTKPATSVVIESEKVPIKLIPMPKHGWIIARASAEDMKKIGEWIEKLDLAKTVEPEQSIVKVRYVDVREVVKIVQRTIREMPVKTNFVIEALPQSKQIVVFGSEENRKMAERLIAEIDRPTDDIFEEQTFKLKHADPDKIKENIEGLYEEQSRITTRYYYNYGRGGSSSKAMSPEDVRVISYPSLKQVTVFASEKNMKRIAKQIIEWDVPIDIETNQYRIITLRNSDPVQMVDLLSTLFSEEGSSNQDDFYRYFFGRGNDSEGKKKIVGSLYGLLTFEPVPDTKKIIVISMIPEAYDVIEKLVRELDSQEMAEVPHVITLKYADAEDLCDQLNAILNEPGTTSTLRRSTRGFSVDTLSDVSGSGDNSSGNAQESESASTSVITPWWNKQRTSDKEMPASNLIGKIRFIPVHRSKALLVLSPPEYYDSIENMIRELDKPGKQVMIKAVIVQIEHSDMTSIGVRLASDPLAFGDLGENAIKILNTLSYAESGSSFTFGSSFGTAGVSVLVDLLVKKANARVLNEPTLWTKDNEEAVFFKGQSVAFLAGDKTDSTGSSLTRSFNYDDVGITLRVRPNITPENAVDVTVNLEISQVEEELINGQIAISKLNTTTNLIVSDGETILLGGILFQTDTDIIKKIPLLGDLPLIGGFFRHEATLQRNNELLAFITPYVIDTDKSQETIEQLEAPKRKLDSIVQDLQAILSDQVPGETL